MLRLVYFCSIEKIIRQIYNLAFRPHLIQFNRHINTIGFIFQFNIHKNSVKRCFVIGCQFLFVQKTNYLHINSDRFRILQNQFLCFLTPFTLIIKNSHSHNVIPHLSQLIDNSYSPIIPLKHLIDIKNNRQAQVQKRLFFSQKRCVHIRFFILIQFQKDLSLVMS